MKKYLEAGTKYAKLGIAGFNEAMIKEFGEEVKPHLLRIWYQIKKTSQETELGNKEKLNQEKIMRYNEINKKTMQSQTDIKDNIDINNSMAVNSQKKKLFTSIPNRLKAIYIVWVFIHFILFLIGRMFDYHNSFYPFQDVYAGSYANWRPVYKIGVTFNYYVYDYSEFLIYTLTPIVVYFVIKLWKKKDE